MVVAGDGQPYGRQMVHWIGCRYPWNEGFYCFGVHLVGWQVKWRPVDLMRSLRNLLRQDYCWNSGRVGKCSLMNQGVDATASELLYESTDSFNYWSFQSQKEWKDKDVETWLSGARSSFDVELVTTVWSKKTDPWFFLTITSVNMDRFKRFFHHWNKKFMKHKN